MSTVREKIIKEIQDINDESLLSEVYKLIHGMQGTNETLKLNKEQQDRIEEAQKDYLNGRYVSTEDLFKKLLDE